MNPADNPFKPPNAKALERESAPVVAPAAVVLATRVLWATLLVGLVSLLPGYRENYWEESAGIEWIIGISVFFTAIFGVLVLSIGKRHNWARWLMLILQALGWVSMATDSSSLMAQGKLAALTDLVTAVAEVYALKLLFLGEGARWFKGEVE